MDPIAERSLAVMSEHPRPALRLSELLRFVAAHVGRRLEVDRLRAVLERHAEHFRVFDAWPYGWGLPAEERGSIGDPWVVLVSTHPEPPAFEPTEGTLRDSVRWIARGIDARSQAQLSRFCAIALAERAASEALRRAA